MNIRPSAHFTPVPLGPVCNVNRGELPAELATPKPAAESFGETQFRGIPFDLGPEAGNNVVLLHRDSVTVELDGRRAPTLAFSPLVGVDIFSRGQSNLQLSLREDFEYGVLPLVGELGIEGESVPVNELAYLGRGREAVTLSLPAGGRAILIGGEPLDEEILIWWNFVGHSKAEIAEAQRDWEAGAERFGSITDYDGEALMPPPLPWKL